MAMILLPKALLSLQGFKAFFAVIINLQGVQSHQTDRKPESSHVTGKLNKQKTAAEDQYALDDAK